MLLYAGRKRRKYLKRRNEKVWVGTMPGDGKERDKKKEQQYIGKNEIMQKTKQ